jgi:hypothetical protein
MPLAAQILIRVAERFFSGIPHPHRHMRLLAVMRLAALHGQSTAQRKTKKRKSNDKKDGLLFNDYTCTTWQMSRIQQLVEYE